MITISNTTVQTLAVGQSITFDNVVWKSGCNKAESFRKGGSSVRTGNGIFEVSFNGNVGGTTAATPVQLSIELDGSPLPETTMKSVPAAATTDFNNVSAITRFGNRPCVCGGVSVTVTNTGTVPIIVDANASLSVKRVGGLN